MRNAQHEHTPRLRDRAPAAQAALDVLALGIPAFKAPAGRRLNLTFADLRHANLGEARFPIPPDLEGANLAGAFLDRASLRDARLDRTTMVDTALAHADLRGAELRDAHLCANFDGARLQGAILDGSDLALATNLENPPASRSRGYGGDDLARRLRPGATWRADLGPTITIAEMTQHAPADHPSEKEGLTLV